MLVASSSVSQERLTLDSVALSIFGALGALGKVEGSGLRWSGTDEPSTTLSDADHELSPLSEVAVQVYNPESSRRKSVQQKKRKQ